MASAPAILNQQNTRSRGWCITWNNPPGTFEEMKTVLTKVFEGAQYWVSGEEVGDSGTRHWQIYVYYENPKKFLTVKNRFKPAQPHIEAAKTTKQAATYCKKDGKFVEVGEVPKQGERSDIAEAVAAVMEGANRKRLAEEFPVQVVKYNRGLDVLRQWRSEAWQGEREVIWVWGPSGAGKSTWARKWLREGRDEDDVYEKMDTSKWWDGYEGQEAVLMDEFRYGEKKDGMIGFADLLNLLGKGKHRVEFKGGSWPWKAKKIVVTSILSPEMMYQNFRESLVQLTRRINRIIVFGAPRAYAVREPVMEQIGAWDPNDEKEPEPEALVHASMSGRQGSVSSAVEFPSWAPSIGLLRVPEVDENGDWA